MTKVTPKQLQRYLGRLIETDPKLRGKSFGSIIRDSEKTLPPKKLEPIQIKNYIAGQLNTNKNFGK